MGKKSESKTTLEELQELRLKLFHTHLFNYNMLCSRQTVFADDGTVELVNSDGTRYRQEGREFISKCIKDFEMKDEEIYYWKCADLKKVLDEYDEKYRNYMIRKRTFKLTEKEEQNLAHFYMVRKTARALIEQRVNAFDEDGTLEVVDDYGNRSRYNGRKYIEDHLRYFEKKDHATWYRLCAKLKLVQDEYDEKFGSK